MASRRFAHWTVVVGTAALACGGGETEPAPRAAAGSPSAAIGGAAGAGGGTCLAVMARSVHEQGCLVCQDLACSVADSCVAQGHIGGPVATRCACVEAKLSCSWTPLASSGGGGSAGG